MIRKASSTFKVLVERVQFVPATKAVFDIAIAASDLISASIITPEAIEKTPALDKAISPLGTTGLKLVPSATRMAVFVLVAINKSSPAIVKSPSIDRFPDESKVALSVAVPADVPDDPPL